MLEPAARPVPWRIIFAAIFAVGAVGLGLVVVWELRKIVTWLLIAGFFAVVLNPAVDFLQQRVRLRRGLAVLVVFVTGVALVAAMLYAFIRPLVDQANEFADNFPTYVADARAGRGTVGHLVKKYRVDDYLQRNEAKLREGLRNAGKPAIHVVRSVATGLAALVTILVLAFLMLLEGPEMLQSGVNALPPPRRKRVRRVAADCARALTGYMAGNLLISLIAGLVTFVGLFVFGVPFRGVLALWVGFADLIPLVGATLGAIPTIGVAFIHSTTAGIGMTILYVVYQQFENHVLQVTIMARTVKINPLLVLVSVLAGVELFGLLGALLAIPAAGVIQVIARDVYDERRGRLKPEPTVGASETPVEEAEAAEAAP
jgi:predicted PurR-regulated permease PerM